MAAVLFDWGGTITPFHDIDVVELWRAAAAVLAPDRVEELTGALHAAELRSWQETAADCRSTRTAEILAAGQRELGLPVRDALHDEAISDYLHGWIPHTLPRPEAREVLQALKNAGLRTGLLSNTHWPRDYHESWLERDGLLELLDARVYTSELQHVKPHREAFETVLAAVGVDPADAVFVGDRAIDDVEGASALGMRTVHLPSGLTPPGRVEPTATLPDLSGLPALVESWR